MKKSLLSITLMVMCGPLAAQTADPATQRWSDSVQFVQGQQAAVGQRASPALGVPPGMAQAQLAQQQALTAQQQALTQSQQNQQASPSEVSSEAATGEISSIQSGDDRPPVEDFAAQKLMWDNDPVQSLRQSGGRFERPLSRGWATSPSSRDQLRLEEWTRHLLNIGVPQHKIDFEARRLNREDFELWASRLVWWEGSEHPNIVNVGY